MTYIVLFVAGFLSASAAIGIWYFPTFRRVVEEKRKLENWNKRLDSTDKALQVRENKYREELAEFGKRHILYGELKTENASLKQDLFNLSVQRKKMDLDQAGLAHQQEELDKKIDDVAGRYMKENVSWVAAKLNPNNFSTCKTRLLKVIKVCRGIGFDVPEEQEDSLVKDLKEKYETILREDFQRQEQSRIRAQIREEERLAREIDKKVREAEREQSAIAAALEKALEKSKDEHSAEVELLRARLKEAEENAQRAKSQAQMTRAGHVYVISNIGSFGEGMLKVGMTRRLEPMDRVKELGDASVPFPFDVHMMISSDDAPTLENTLHRELHKKRVNKVNFRKEYFHTDIELIRGIVEKHHGKVDYVADPEALQFRETLEMSEDDYEFIEKTATALAVETGESMTED